MLLLVVVYCIIPLALGVVVIWAELQARQNNKAILKSFDEVIQELEPIIPIPNAIEEWDEQFAEHQKRTL